MEPREQSETSRQNRPVLPDEWIEKLFLRLSCLYGRKFADLWAGVDPVAVRKLWAEKLGAFTGEVIGRALTACDSRPYPPTLPEFLMLCRAENNRFPEFKSLPAPPIDKELARKRMAEIAKFIKERNHHVQD